MAVANSRGTCNACFPIDNSVLVRRRHTFLKISSSVVDLYTPFKIVAETNGKML
jgi:hypothetical protein